MKIGFEGRETIRKRNYFLPNKSGRQDSKKQVLVSPRQIKDIKHLMQEGDGVVGEDAVEVTVVDEVVVMAAVRTKIDRGSWFHR